MNCQFHASNAKRQRFSRWLLVLVLCWQSLMMFMPVAQAKAAAGEGGWETICTMNGSAQVWVAADADTEGETHDATGGGHCPLCLMSSAGLAPPPVHKAFLESGLGVQDIQLVFNASYLTRAWSEQARGPPAHV
ncbi:MAG: DUF2946 domain-containing protein [Fluviibacter sp.]